MRWIVGAGILVMLGVIGHFLLRLKEEWDGGPPVWAFRMAVFGIAGLIWVGAWSFVVAISVISTGGFDSEAYPPELVQGIGWVLIIGAPIVAIVFFKKMFARTYDRHHLGLGPTRREPIIRMAGGSRVVPAGVVAGIALSALFIVGILVALLVYAVVIALVFMFVVLTIIFITTMFGN